MKHFRGWKNLSPLEIDQVLAQQPRAESTRSPMQRYPGGKKENTFQSGTLVLNVAPMPAPRLNRKSRFNPEKKQLFKAYMAWKKTVQLLAQQAGWEPTESLHVTFILPMPKSWSKTKRKQMIHTPHRQKPDRNNLMKALEDALYQDDSGVWKSTEEKLWGPEGKIILKKGVSDD